MTSEEAQAALAELSDDTLQGLLERDRQVVRGDEETPESRRAALGRLLLWRGWPAVLERLVTEIQRNRAAANPLDALEAWRMVDPVQRLTNVEMSPAGDRSYQVRVMLSEGRTGRVVVGYDTDGAIGWDIVTGTRSVVRAGHRCGVAAVVAAALARWRELYPEEGATP